MRTNTVMLAMLVGVGLSGSREAMAEAKNLSCISGIAPNEQRLIRDCGPEPQYVVLYAEEPPPPPPPLPPRTIKHGEGGKGAGPRRGEKDHDAPAGGGDPGGPSF